MKIVSITIENVIIIVVGNSRALDRSVR